MNKPARTSLLTIIVLIGISTSIVRGDDADHHKPNPPAAEYSREHQFVFFAALEGCYRDRLVAKDHPRIIPKPENGGREMTANFVDTYPLCHRGAIRKTLRSALAEIRKKG